MKTLIIMTLVLIQSCSSLAPGLSKVKRNPSSMLESYDGKVVKMSSDLFSDDVDETRFDDFLADAQNKGIEQLIITPPVDRFQKVSMTDQTSISGDFYLLIGTNFEKNDEIIRRGDYDDIYSTAKRLSGLRFRVIINLVASVEDLRSALTNKKPTIIVWTSHGNEEGFLDFNQVKVPFNIFRNASPNVYQFILTACNGFKALQKGYKEHIPKTMKQWSWDRVVWHPTDMKAMMTDENQWNPFTNYPGKFSYKGLTCSESKEGYKLFHNERKKVIGTNTFAKLEDCIFMVANSNDHFVCNKNGNLWDIYSKKTLNRQDSEGFETNYECNSRVHNTYNGKTCRKVGNKFRFFDSSKDFPSEEGFSGREECFNYIQNMREA